MSCRVEVSFGGEVAGAARAYGAAVRRVVAGVVRFARPGRPSAVGALITGDREIRRMNGEFRGVDAPTDVLSFPEGPYGRAEPPGPTAPRLEAGPGDAGDYLGDIAISYEAAERQARELGHGAEREVAFLAAHGALHLLGHDHHDARRADLMFAEQGKVLLYLGYMRSGSDPGTFCRLIGSAAEAARLSYSPYSGHAVGAGVLGGDGVIHVGANVESASFGATCCAERVALYGAITRGAVAAGAGGGRADGPAVDAVAVVGPGPGLPTPCGICRQVIAEHAGRGTPIVCASEAPRGARRGKVGPGEFGGIVAVGPRTYAYRVYSIGELLPDAFLRFAGTPGSAD